MSTENKFAILGRSIQMLFSEIIQKSYLLGILFREASKGHPVELVIRKLY